MLKLIKVETLEQVEWLRVQRSRPELYRYFGQDKPISEKEQAIWWKNLDKKRSALFIIEKDGEKVGYVGFDPLNKYAMRAKFGIFIIPEQQGKGYGSKALMMLLGIGFENYLLAAIYSDCLDYVNENRFGFYEKLGFEKYPPEIQTIRYRKEGQWVPSCKFFMTWETYDNIRKSQLGLKTTQKAGREAGEKWGKGSRLHSGKNYVNAVPK